jgi:hypothetical protein
MGTTYGPAFEINDVDTFLFQGRVGNPNDYPATQPIFKFGAGMGMRSRIAGSEILSSGYPQVQQNSKNDFITYIGDGITVTNSVDGYSYNPVYWNPIHDREVDVREFGADGIYGTDYYTNLQYAIYAATNRAAWSIYLPPGAYKVSDTLVIPHSGQQSITNRFHIRAQDWTTTYVYADQTMTNKPVFRQKTTGTTQGSLGMYGLGVYGPALAWGRTNYATTSVGLGAACVELGDSATYAGGYLGQIETTIERCYFSGHRFGLTVTNGQNLTLKDCWITENAISDVVFAHVDTATVDHGHYGYVLYTNRAAAGHAGYSFAVIGTPGSTWNVPSYYLGGADSGVHKIFKGLEHSGPFLWADAARIDVEGGQFENGTGVLLPITNGWCYLTNVGQYNFKGATINMPTFAATATNECSTNTVLFYCSGNASAGLRVEGCTITTGFDDTLNQNAARWFRILGDPDNNYLYHPYWSFGAFGESAANVGQNKTTYKNCLYTPNGGSAQYIHIPPMHLGAISAINGATLTNAPVVHGVHYGSIVNTTNFPETLNLYVRDEFMSATNASGSFGELGWKVFSGAAPYLDNPAANHPTIWRFDVNNTTNAVGGISLHARDSGYPISLGTPYSATFIFKLTTGTGLDLFVGMANSTGPYYYNNSVVNDTYAYGLFVTNGTSGGTFKFKASSGGAPTISDSGVAVDTSWHKLKIEGGSANTVFTLDNNTPVTIGVGYNSSGFQPQFLGISGGLGEASFDVDFFMMQQYLSR